MTLSVTRKMYVFTQEEIKKALDIPEDTELEKVVHANWNEHNSVQFHIKKVEHE